MKKRQILAAALVGIFLLTATVEPLSTYAKTTTEDLTDADTDPAPENSAYAENALKQMEKVAENEYLELYFEDTETVVAVRDKASGELWFTNPVDTSEDDFSTGFYEKALKSQLYVTYIDESTKVSTMNNYASSIENGQFEVEMLENGIKVTYFIGDSALMIRLPDVISEERLNGFLEKMPSEQQKKVNHNYTLYVADELDEDEKEEILAKYPLLAEQNLYILRSGAKDYMREDLAEYFAEAGYTQEDYELDMAGNAVGDEDDEPWFSIPLVYELDGENLIVTVNPDEVEYNTNGYYLVGIDILRYFGASMQEDGYIFVPDGSGALIYFNNGKTAESSYGAAVYGQDAAMIYNAYNQSQIDAESTIKLPVFGIKESGKALFAVIEGGDAYASIKADVAGKYTGYNDVYASFNYLQYGTTSLSDMVGSQSYYMYSDAVFEGSYTLRYSFLTGEQADYSGMAACYRSYLKEQGVLGEKTMEQELPFYVEYIGAIDKPKTFLGIKYNAVETVTTYEQAEEITSLLKQNGVDDISVIYSGWMDGGLHGTASSGVKAESGLKKGGESLSDLQDYMSHEAVSLYMTADLQYVYKDGVLDGYSSIRYAPRYFDNTVVKINAYGLASRVTEDTFANLISPFYVNEIAQKLGRGLQKKNVSGVNMGSISWELFSDMQSSAYADRQMAEKENCAAMQSLQDAGQSLLGDNANAYAFTYAEEVINVPFYSNNYRILDEEVPFYEMVLHGYIPFAGEALNLTDDYETALLKSAESGAGMYFKWIYAENTVLKDTEYDDLYSVNYEAWLAQATEDYARMNRELGRLSCCEIVSHVYVQEDVSKVIYENGSCVYVNFSKEDVTVDGILIPSRDYVVKEN